MILISKKVKINAKKASLDECFTSPKKRHLVKNVILPKNITSPKKRHFAIFFSCTKYKKRCEFHTQISVLEKKCGDPLYRKTFFGKLALFGEVTLFFAKMAHFRGLKKSGPCSEVTQWQSDTFARLRVELTLVWRSDAFLNSRDLGEFNLITKCSSALPELFVWSNPAGPLPPTFATFSKITSIKGYEIYQKSTD